jgi:hypothetical protein
LQHIKPAVKKSVKHNARYNFYGGGGRKPRAVGNIAHINRVKTAVYRRARFKHNIKHTFGVIGPVRAFFIGF